MIDLSVLNWNSRQDKKDAGKNNSGKNNSGKKKTKNVNLKAIKPIVDDTPKRGSGGRQGSNSSGTGGGRRGAGNVSNNRGSHVGGNGSAASDDLSYRSLIREEPQNVFAPYNFVPVWDKVIRREESEIPSQGILSQEYLSGEITYELKALTPILVDQGDAGECEPHVFYENAEGKFAIPGSTMKGLIRSCAQVLSCASLGDDIEDYALMYRNVANGAEKKRYEKILGGKTVPIKVEDGKEVSLSILENVQAGYIVNRDGDYYIYRTVLEAIDPQQFGRMNYYVVSERYILDRYTKTHNSGGKSEFDYVVENGFLQHILAGNAKALDQIWKEIEEKDKKKKKEREGGTDNFVKYYEKGKDGSKRYHYRGKPNPNFLPLFQPVSYRLDGQRSVTAIGESGTFGKEGYMLITGPMKEKKAVYIIPERDANEENGFWVPEETIRQFRIDYNRRKNSLSLPVTERNPEKSQKYKEFFDLPKPGEDPKPVFYIDEGKYIGFTPRLRLFYDQTVKKGLAAAHLKEDYDYCRALFGYSKNEKSRRARVSFSDAPICGNAMPLDADRANLVLLEPKPTDCYNYLEPVKVDGGYVCATYNDSNFRIRGVKQYHVRKKVVTGNVGANQNVSNKIRPLPADTVFSGTVRFNNLTREELGLLLYSMTLEKNSVLNLGKAKAYGYGVCKLSITKARLFDLEKAYPSDGSLPLSPFTDLNQEEMIAAYKDAVFRKLNGKKIETLPSVRAFFLLKDITRVLPDSQLSHMVLNGRDAGQSNTGFDYQKRENVILPQINTLYGEGHTNS